jgi:hypothetical protein
MLNAAPLFFSVLLNAQSIHTSSTCHAEQSEASMSRFLCKNRKKSNPRAIRLIRVFRVLLLYGFLTAFGMTKKCSEHHRPVMLNAAKRPRFHNLSC